MSLEKFPTNPVPNPHEVEKAFTFKRKYLTLSKVNDSIVNKCVNVLEERGFARPKTIKPVEKGFLFVNFEDKTYNVNGMSLRSLNGVSYHGEQATEKEIEVVFFGLLNEYCPVKHTNDNEPNILENILEEMIEESNNWDTENCHSNADTLLKETIKVLNAYTPEELKETVDKILNTYDKVDKWYA